MDESLGMKGSGKLREIGFPVHFVDIAGCTAGAAGKLFRHRRDVNLHTS